MARPTGTDQQNRLGLPDFVQYWARELGVSAGSIVQLSGGINNFVYRCQTDHCSFVLKGYPGLQSGERDRMQAEVEFLRYANVVAKEFVPELLHIDTAHRCVVLEHLDGCPYAEGVPPPQADIDAACAFFARLNNDLDLAKTLVQLAAADGYLRLTEHLQNVDGRLSTMGVGHLPTMHRQQANTLLQRLLARVDAVKQSLYQGIHAGRVADAIDEQLLVVSASDFGFHNAICTSKGVRFIDFEFAGWDDPAKAVADFVLQPRIPLNLKYSPLLATWAPCTRELVIERLVFLSPILHVKWLCIILSVLQAERLVQLMATHRHMDADALIVGRLAVASKYFGEEGPLGLH